MACQQTTSQLVGVTTTGLTSELFSRCCGPTGTIGSEVVVDLVDPDPSPQNYEGNCPAPS